MTQRSFPPTESQAYSYPINELLKLSLIEVEMGRFGVPTQHSLANRPSEVLPPLLSVADDVRIAHLLSSRLDPFNLASASRNMAAAGLVYTEV